MNTQVRITGNLNTTHLAEAVAAELGVSHRQGAAAVRAVFDTVVRTVAAGHSVTVTNFGSWHPYRCAPYVARNPQTGERIPVPAQPRLRFRQADRLRALLEAPDPSGATIRKLPRALGRTS